MSYIFTMPLKPMKAIARMQGGRQGGMQGRGCPDSAPGFSLSLQFIVKYINQ